MGDKNENEKQKFQFLHEEVLESKRRTVRPSQVIILVTVCAIIFGTVACLMFLGLMPTMKELFHKKDGNEVLAGTSKAEESNLTELLGEDETISNQSLEDMVEDALKEYPKENDDFYTVKKHLREIGMHMESAMVTLVSYKSQNWFDQEEKDRTVTSGIVISASLENGITVLTNQSSLIENQKLVVYLSDKKGYPAEIIQESSMVGIALVHIEASLVEQTVIDALQVVDIANFADIQSTKGQCVALLGNPYSTNRYMAYGELTSVSAVKDQTDIRYELMTTNVKDGGSMNGFILNMDGQLLGMVIQEHKSDKMNYFVAATNLRDLKIYIQRMLAQRNVSYVGINGQEITEEIAKKVDKDMPRGIYITGIDDQSPAFQAGLMRGDILVAVENCEVQTIETYANVLQQYDVGEIVKLTVMRKGKDGYKSIIYDVTIGNH